MSADSEVEFRAEICDDELSLLGPEFGVAFHRGGDQWTHAVFSLEPGVVLAKSAPDCPGSDDHACIADPVYQDAQLHGAIRGPALCLLLTGNCHNHHFSAAVTLARDMDRPCTARLDFDVADRCRANVESLAATYLVGLDSGALVAADPERIAWEVADPIPGRLELVAGPSAMLALAEAGRKAARVQILARIQPGAFTHRLRYGWRWTSTDALTR
jgi:hypothetical protein